MPPKQARPTRPAPTTRPPRQPFSTSTTTVVPSHTLSPLGYSPVPVQHLSPFPSSTNLLAETPVQAEAGPAGEGGSGSNTVDKLRSWRDDASRAHMYEAAAFWGDKVLTITYEPSDALALAQIYFSTSQYTRAERLLSHPALLETNPMCQYLAALCAVNLEKYPDALQLLGEPDPDLLKKQMPTEQKKLESALQHLRGIVYGKMSDYERAKECHLSAVKLDVQCYESFNLLVSGHMLTAEEERDLVESLDFDGQLGPEGELVHLLYTTQIRKHRSGEDVEEPIAALETDWKLAFNPDLNAARAESYYAQCQFQKALDVTSRILDYDPHNLSVLPLHVACLHELSRKHQLFYLAHELVARYPDKPVTWYAVGSYYLLIERSEEARRYFAKATVVDNGFGPAWIGFAHAFVKEGEHDQAIAGYATASRLFKGMHLPIMYIGMQHLQLTHHNLAEEYLLAAHDLCKTDPLLHNELGTLYYNTKRYELAVKSYERALELAGSDLVGRGKVWEGTWSNLGHCYRKLGQYGKAKSHLEKVLTINPTNSSAHAGLGMIAHLQGDLNHAITCYHQALAVEEDDLYSELLNLALEELPARGGPNRDPKSNLLSVPGQVPVGQEDNFAGADMEREWVPAHLRVQLLGEEAAGEHASRLTPGSDRGRGGMATAAPSTSTGPATRKGKEAQHPIQRDSEPPGSVLPRAPSFTVDMVTPLGEHARSAPPLNNRAAGTRRRIESFQSDGSIEQVEEEEEEDGEGFEDYQGENGEDVYADEGEELEVDEDEGEFSDDMEMG